MSFCTICKDELYIPTSLSCAHVFCLLCIKNHLYNRSFCPLCNMQVHISELEIKKGFYKSRLCKYERKLCFVNNKFICDEDRVDVINNNIEKQNMLKIDSIDENEKNLENGSHRKNYSFNDRICEKNDAQNKSIDATHCQNTKILTTKGYLENKKPAKLPEIKLFIFYRITEVKLKKMCKEYNLRTGNKQEMIDRLKDFYLMYTVEKETVNPLSLYGISNIINKKTYKRDVNYERFLLKNIVNINDIRNKFILQYKSKTK